MTHELGRNLRISEDTAPGPKLGSVAEINMFLPPPNADFYATDIYKPLDHRRAEIRLVRLLPPNGPTLQLEFMDGAFLDDPDAAVSYEALSYSAGDVLDTEPVILNGQKFNIFRSLALALAQIRHLTGQALWIDQICINQGDDRERERQVLLMQLIYNARRTSSSGWGHKRTTAWGCSLLHKSTPAMNVWNANRYETGKTSLTTWQRVNEWRYGSPKS